LAVLPDRGKMRTLTRLCIIINNDLNKRFRAAINETNDGIKKGDVSRAVEEAIELWIRHQTSDIKREREPKHTFRAR